MNDTAITSDGLSISVTDVDVKQVNRIMAPEGAQYLFVKISVTNNGDSKTPYDTVHIQKQTYINGINVASTKDIITLQYNNQKIFPEDSAHYGLENDWGWEGFGNKYPGVTKEGWVCFEVQENLDLNRTAITVHGLKWNLGS